MIISCISYSKILDYTIHRIKRVLRFQCWTYHPVWAGYPVNLKPDTGEPDAEYLNNREPNTGIADSRPQ